MNAVTMIWKYLKMLREYPNRKHIGEELRSSEVEKRITALKSLWRRSNEFTPDA